MPVITLSAIVKVLAAGSAGASFGRGQGCPVLDAANAPQGMAQCGCQTGKLLGKRIWGGPKNIAQAEDEGGRSVQQSPEHQVESRRGRRCCRYHTWDSWQLREESTPASRHFPTGTWACGKPTLGLSKRTAAHEVDPGWSRGQEQQSPQQLLWIGHQSLRRRQRSHAWRCEVLGRVVFYSFWLPFSLYNFNWQ